MVLLRMEAPLTFPTSSTDLLLMAASRVQGMLVAPRTRTPLLSLPTPCICTRNSVLMRLADSDSFSLREPHKASTSSMKMMLGWLSRASSNSVLTSLWKCSKNQGLLVDQMLIRLDNGMPTAYSYSTAAVLLRTLWLLYFTVHIYCKEKHTHTTLNTIRCWEADQNKRLHSWLFNMFTHSDHQIHVLSISCTPFPLLFFSSRNMNLWNFFIHIY